MKRSFKFQRRKRLPLRTQFDLEYAFGLMEAKKELVAYRALEKGSRLKGCFVNFYKNKLAKLPKRPTLYFDNK